MDWKVLDILNFWKKNKSAFGKFFHQCLIYARLLQLHMDLDYLPHILIVPISSRTGEDIHLALFWDYPIEGEEAIETFKWSLTFPTQFTTKKRNIVIIRATEPTQGEREII